ASTPSRAATTLLTMLLFLRARRVKASSLGSSSTNKITLFSIFYLHEIRECEIEVCLRQQKEKALGSRCDSSTQTSPPQNFICLTLLLLFIRVQFRTCK